MNSDARGRWLLLWICIFWLCGTVSWYHLANVFHMLDKDFFLTFRHDPTQATHPAIHRMLIPLLYQLVPGSLRGLSSGMNAPLDSFNSAFLLIVDTVALFASFYFFSKAVTLRSDRPESAHATMIAWLVFFYVVVMSYVIVPNRAQYFPYDFVDIAFFSLVLWLATDEERTPLVALPLAIFAATLNKETGIFFVLVFFVLRMSSPQAVGRPLFGRDTMRIVMVTALAGVVGIAGKYAALRLSLYFSQDTVAPALFYSQLEENVRQLRNPLFWFVFLAMFGFAWIVPLITRRPLSRELLGVYALVAVWIALIFVAGISRGLRVYGPMGLLVGWAVLSYVLSTRLADRGASADAQR